METPARPPFVFVGNSMVLDLVNTELVNRGRPVDLLQTFEDLVSWLQQAGAIGERPAEEALNRWGGTRDADETLRYALALRAALREMAMQITQGASVPTESLDLVNSILRRRHGYTQVVQSEDGYRRVFHLEVQQPEDLLVPVAEAAGDLICNADLSLIRKCENPKCVLYYWDTSKNHARRWCSMTVCGNRAKAAAHYRRVRAKADSTGSSPQDMDT